MSQIGVMKPDWLVVGARRGDAHVVLASDSLDRTELEAVYHDGDEWSLRDALGGTIISARAPDVVAHYELRATIVRRHGRESVVFMTAGETYAQALRRMLEFLESEGAESSLAALLNELRGPQ